MNGFALLSLAILAGAPPAPSPAQLREALRKAVAAREPEILTEFRGLLARPNLASDATDIQRNAESVARMLEKRGVHTELLQHPGAPPVVYGDLPARRATRTVVFYAHYESQ